VSFSDERDHAEEQANRALMQEEEHCIMGVEHDDDVWRTPRNTSCTDVDGGGDCVHCPCCCTCLGCEYGPRDGMELTEAQRAPIRAIADGGAS
jgi:hypothetical protein